MIPVVFAVADKVIAQPQTSIFAAFGSFAVLILVQFEGSGRTRLLAYLGLALTGAVYIPLGTLCSRDAWLAAGAMAAVGFVTLFAGGFSGYAAAGATGAILTFVLPVTIRAPDSAIPDRLEGWALACGAGICAAMVLWPPGRRADFQRQSAAALRAVADLVESPREALPERETAARAAVASLVRASLGSQHRPAGPEGATAALASLPDELDWLLSFLAPPAAPATPEVVCVEDAEAMAASADVLRASADRLDGQDAHPDFNRLDAAHREVARALMRRLPQLEGTGGLVGSLAVLDSPFRIRVVTYSARQAALYALTAAGANTPGDPVEVAAHPPARPTLSATEHLALEHVSTDSVWFQNSVRGAIGLAIAVYVAQRTGLQHGFWVVLGTLSVLRSNALGTGWSIMSALAGTAVGIVAGALLVIGIGTHQAVLWAVLPLAILLAAYAPRAISFAAGQAGFTVVLFVLFNIIQPVGWRVGEVRVEDVAIGFAISLAVGLLFWPRGAAAVLRRDLAGAYATGADYVAATARELFQSDDETSGPAARRAADTAIHRLDDAFRQYLTERSATAASVEEVGALVGGASRLRRAAQSLTDLRQMVDGGRRLESCGRNLDAELHALQSWYLAFGYAIVNRRRVPPPHIRDDAGRTRLLACLGEASLSPEPATEKAALMLLWASQHLDSLWDLEGHLDERANALEDGLGRSAFGRAALGRARLAARRR